ncbi:related to transcription initiation factor TFIIF subunit [Phialocephala subalpina]|uniref:Transcription initiation factor IIF subunit beta n=1 Tax=Phialocephala subalpina TaxID=576137 RepID=A0A1L7WN35_9HELO|nr:related to transcription initiation factor TFIIF subunit [Phialocephala subalpina]
MADAHIKPDPEVAGASPGAFSEEDIYEDAGDLEFNEDPAFKSLYLAKVPRYMWEAWSKLDDDAEIPIGTIRVTQEAGPDGQKREKLHMLLNSDIAAHQPIPKEYMLDITEEKVKNTFAFTEKDLPGFKSKSRQTFDLATANMPARLTRPKNEKPLAKEPYDPNKRFQPYFRKAIPKRTAIAGKVAHEVNCIAVINQESERILGQRTLDAMKPKRFTKFLNEDLSALSSGFIQPGTIHAQNTFTDFIKTKNPSSGPRPQLTKTARMPENELMDRIFGCFRRYNYWSMKALRAELQQPEAYLREVLERVAVLAKSGRFATQWSLKQEYKAKNYEGMDDAVAPMAEGAGAEESDMADEEDGDDDEDVKFEDVA